MIQFVCGGVRVRVCFGFFAAVTAYYYLYGRDQAAVAAALTACFLHEAGHLAAMFALGEKPRAVCLYAGGMKIIPPARLSSRGRQTVILSAGCTVNALLAAGAYLGGAERLMYASAAVGLLNMMPFSALDGGRVMSLYLTERTRRAAAIMAAGIIAAVEIREENITAAIITIVFITAAEFTL